MDLLTPTIPWIRALQSHDWLLGPMKSFTFLGNEEFFLLLLPVIFWLVDRNLGARLGVLLLVSVCLNDVLKHAFHLPRPYWDGSVEQWATETTFGFPSGHAQNAMLLWPFLALQSRNKKVWLPLAIGLAALISLSRVYLGAHYPLDVLGGIFIGLGLLWFSQKMSPAFLGFWKVPSNRWWFAVLLPVVYGFLKLALYRWAENRGDWLPIIESLRLTVGVAGALAGLLLGLALSQSFVAEKQLGKVLGRSILGFLGLAFFYFGLKRILPDELIFRFVRYFLTTFWIAFGAPWLFVRCKLAPLQAPDTKIAAR